MNDFKVFHLSEKQLAKIVYEACEKSRERDDVQAVRLAVSMAEKFNASATSEGKTRVTFEAAPIETATMNEKPAAGPKPQTEAVSLKELM